jgi:hypothetical protein
MRDIFILQFMPFGYFLSSSHEQHCKELAADHRKALKLAQEDIAHH